MFNYKEVFDATLEYFNGDDLATKVWIDKYALRDNQDNLLEKTPDDMHRRLAKEFARIEAKKFKNPLTEEEIYELFRKFKRIVPQGGPMFGIGNIYQYVSLGNCFVLPSPYDSYLGITYTDAQITQISSRRGGVGWDISKLRPKNLSVKNAAKSTTGAVSFMHRYSNTINEVCQAGRRGASLQSISIHHPDVLDFIQVKRNLTNVTGSNVSIQFTDEFMNAVLKDVEYEQRWPVCKEHAEEMNLPFPVISKKVKARDIWKEFIIGARDYAEPGAAFIDQVHRESTGFYHGQKEVTSNPCVTKGTLVNTPDGFRKVEDIKIGDYISTVLGSEPVKEIEINENCEVFRIKFSDGGEQTVTENHIYYITPKNSNSKIVTKTKVKDIKIGDYIRVHPSKFKDMNFDTIEYQNGLKAGILLGDGCYTEKSLSKNIIKIASSIDEQNYNSNLISLFGEMYYKNNDISKRSKAINLIFDSKCVNLQELGLKSEYCETKSIDLNRVNNYSFAIGLLDGLLATDGNINLSSNHPQLRWVTSSSILSQQIRQILLYIECHGFIDINFSKGGIINGREILRKHPKHTITISGESFKNYTEHSKIIDLHPSKGKKLIDAIINFRLTGNSWMASILSIEKLQEKYTTYDLFCEKSDTWITSGYVQQGCGEQYLPPYASCRLIAINTTSYVTNPFLDSKFDFDKFYNDCYLMQRLADDMVDLEIEHLDRIIAKIESDPEPQEIKQIGISLWKNIKDTAIKDRRTGCGFTGLGDTIAMLNMKYGSEDSIQFAEKMQKQFKYASYQCSIDLAKELGSFPNYSFEQDIKSEFIKRLQEECPALVKEMMRYGRRNMVLLTVAPTGSLSCLTQTTSGIEPTIFLQYTRRKKGNPGDSNFRSDFIDQNGCHWQEFNVMHHGVKLWQIITNKTDINESPYYGCTANDIDWIAKSKLQGILQKHIDNGISVTTNLPNNISYDDVDKIYIEAWKNGCKGCTVYREGSRSGVLVDKSQKHDKRPKEVKCDVHHITVKGKHYLVLVGILNDHPYEVFSAKNGFLDRNIKHGTIIKNKRAYKVVFEDESELSPIMATASDEEEAITRLVSCLLRKNVELTEIVKQLEKVSGDMTIFAKSISRTLKKYIASGTNTGEQCPDCGSSLIYQEGCKSCSAKCGYSKCN